MFSFSSTLFMRPRVVIIGTGWAGVSAAKYLDMKAVTLTVLSTRNHFVFTPLLPQTCTGTLEFRAVCDPVVNIQPALAESQNHFYNVMVRGVDFDRKQVTCITADGSHGSKRGWKSLTTFDLDYDYLILAHGARANTFNIPGVEDHAFFLREVYEARGIRRHLIHNVLRARLPSTSHQEKRRLLSVVVVGGGPTGVEFAGDLADFLYQDLPKIAPGLRDDFTVTLVEANDVLGSFEQSLRDYAATRLRQVGVRLKKATVKEVKEEMVVLNDGDVIPTGLVIWSTGVGPSALTTGLDCDKAKSGRIAVDTNLRVLRNNKPLSGVYAAGDCAAYAESTGEEPLPTLAAVASRQGKYLSRTLNKMVNDVTLSPDNMPPFHYKHLGSMATLGHHTALVEFHKPGRFDIRGIRAWLTWRSAYFTMLGNLRSRLYVLVNWCGSALFGRDITYIADINEVKLMKQLMHEDPKKVCVLEIEEYDRKAQAKHIKQQREGRVAAASADAKKDQ
eukprot:PhM_4_TR617/c0_g1_i1/m.74103/K17871/ndh1; NADH:ubiquinone reductase (non-electrogenic)